MTVFQHHPQPIVGTSGALLYVSEHVKVKVAAAKAAVKVRDRINEQGAYLVVHNDVNCLPRVYTKWNGGYAMETLVPADLSPECRLRHLEVIRRKLEFELWRPDVHCQDVRVAGTVLLGHHRDYVNALLMQWAPELKPKMLGWLLGIARLNLAQVITHGDPTIDNLMHRQNGDYVLTDPIPASPKMPALLASDLGKMLQSVWSYEDVRRGNEPRCPYVSGCNIVLRGQDPMDVEAAKYFLAVHLLRLIPYQKYHRDVFLSQLTDIVKTGVA